MTDTCVAGLSNYDRFKQRLITANMWKASFINLWKKYGSFETIDGAEVFKEYRIDGPGEGQKKMSFKLQDRELWKTTQHEDIERVSLFFDLQKLITVDADAVEQWATDTKESLHQDDFDVLRYEIDNKEVVSYGFVKFVKNDAGEVVEEMPVEIESYDEIAYYLAQIKLEALLANENSSNSFIYEEEVTVEDIGAMIDESKSTTLSDEGEYTYSVITEETVQGYMSKEGIGVDILDELVQKGQASSTGVIGLDRRYYLSVEQAQKMNGLFFIELVSKTLEFKVKKKGGFWRALKRFMKLILAAVAVYFQQYWLAASLLVGFVADETNSKVLRIVSGVLGLMQGDFSSFSNIGVGEAMSLLLNVYSIYVDIKFDPVDGKDVAETTDTTQEMLYEAPFDAYDNLHCYEELTTVSIANINS